jgi:AraC-like DNA-binding protein
MNPYAGRNKETGNSMNGNEVKFWRSRTVAGLELKHTIFRNFSFNRHIDDRYMIGLEERGIEWFSCRRRQYAAAPGDIVLYHPDDIHDGGSTGREPWGYRCFFITESLVRQMTARDSGTGPLPCFPDNVVHDPQLAGCFLALHRLFESGEDTLQVQTDFLELFSKLIDRHTQRGDEVKSPGTAHNRGALLRSRDFLEAHFNAPITLKQLSSQAGLSPFHFLREFKRIFGMPPHQYQRQVQVRRAKELLGRGVPIVTVAADTGFCDQSHLNRVFKSFTGLTPGQFQP